MGQYRVRISSTAISIGVTMLLALSQFCPLNAYAESVIENKKDIEYIKENVRKIEDSIGTIQRDISDIKAGQASIQTTLHIGIAIAAMFAAMLGWVIKQLFDISKTVSMLLGSKKSTATDRAMYNEQLPKGFVSPKRN